jgi:dTDP-4-amino-4,6-dideoxygalactose transaminase
MLPYGRQSINSADADAVAAALRSDWLTTGPNVEVFENSLSASIGNVPCAAVSSGTAALLASYAALNITSGHEVVVTPMTFIATAACAAMRGATIVFADIDEDTANIDPPAVEAAVTSRTSAVAAVDFAGHPADYDALRVVCDRVGAGLVADAAHSLGGEYYGRPVGSLADLTAFSFFPTKNITTAEGGAVACADSERLGRIKRFRTVGLVRETSQLRYPDEGPWHQEVHEFGLNLRLPDVLCALGISQLKRLNSFMARRRTLAARYFKMLADVEGLRLPTAQAHVSPAWHFYPVRIRDGRRREIYEKMRAAGVGVQVNYVPVYWHPVFEDLGYKRGLCPNAEAYYAEELSLPMFPALTDDQQTFVAATLIDALG